MPRMARHILLLPELVCLIAVSTAAEAAPAASADAVRAPVMHKRIFANPADKPPTDTKDVLQLGLSKRDSTRQTKSSSPVMAVATSAAALIFVVGIFLLIAWFMKRSAMGGVRALPSEAFEVLGRSSFNTQQTVQLVRVGNRLLLVASSTEGVRTLTEIDDADEVERLSMLCLAGSETSATQEFQDAFEELASGSAEITTESSAAESNSSHRLLDLSSEPTDSLALSEASLLASNR